MTEVDVVIVGAGLSGLMAGYKLHEKDPSLLIIIIEAKGIFLFYKIVGKLVIIYFNTQRYVSLSIIILINEAEQW